MLYEQRPGQQLPWRRQLWSGLWTLRSMGYSDPLSTPYIQVSFIKSIFRIFCDRRRMSQNSDLTDLKKDCYFQTLKILLFMFPLDNCSWKSRFLLLNVHINCFGVFIILMYSIWVVIDGRWKFSARNVCVAVFFTWLLSVKCWDFWPILSSRQNKDFT